ALARLAERVHEHCRSSGAALIQITRSLTGRRLDTALLERAAPLHLRLERVQRALCLDGFLRRNPVERRLLAAIMSRIDRWIEAEWQVTRMRVLNKLGEMIFVEGAD